MRQEKSPKSSLFFVVNFYGVSPHWTFYGTRKKNANKLIFILSAAEILLLTFIFPRFYIFLKKEKLKIPSVSLHKIFMLSLACFPLFSVCYVNFKKSFEFHDLKCTLWKLIYIQFETFREEISRTKFLIQTRQVCWENKMLTWNFKFS